MARITVYPKDIASLTGKSERWGRLCIEKIKAKNKKEPHQLITIEEASCYLGLPINTVKESLKC